MTAPVRTRPAPVRRAPRTAPSSRPSGPGRSAAAQRAYSRRTDRSQRWTHLVPDPLSKAAVVRRVPFVAVIIGLLGLGLVATLWLSTNSAEDSYQLTSAQKQTRLLSEQVEALQRDVATMSSAASLAQHASQLGMVPTTNVAHLVVGEDGKVTVVGKPAPAALPVTPAIPSASPVATTPATPAAPVAAAPAPVAPAPAAPSAPASSPVAGAPTPSTALPQAHSEQIQPGPGPVSASGGA